MRWKKNRRICSTGIAISVVLGVHFFAVRSCILVNITPSVPLGLYARVRSLSDATHVAFRGEKYGRKETKIIKRFFVLPSGKIYVYGIHPNSLTSAHIGAIDRETVIPMRRIMEW